MRISVIPALDVQQDIYEPRDRMDSQQPYLIASKALENGQTYSDVIVVTPSF